MIRRLPMLLLAVLFGLLVVFVATQADAYGRTFDETFQDTYGTAVLKWYASGGHDRRFLSLDPNLHLPQHGPFFETVVAAAQHLFGAHWHTRAVVCGIAGVIGIAGIALCGLELAGWWGALIAALGLTLYPRYTGAIFNNSKDVPLAAVMTFVLWATLRLVRRWRWRWSPLVNGALVGVLLGVAASIRVTGLVWLGTLGLLVAGWWGRYGYLALARHQHGFPVRELLRQAATAATIGVSCYLTMFALWPYITVHPRFGLVDSVAKMSAYEWNGPVFFDGRQILAKELPWWYAPDWLVIGSPLPTVLLAVLGGGLLVADLVRRRAPDLGTVLAGSLLVVPIAVVVALHATLYDSLRHVLFTVPGMILLGTVCLIRLWEAIRRRGHRLLAWVLVAAVLIGQADVAVQVARLRPLEYVYFSPVVGGFSAARRHYETDYWAACQTLALRWLTAHYRTYTAAPNPTVHGLTAAAYDGASPTVFRDAPANQDFLFADGDSAPAPGYTRIHEVRVEGVTVCTVNVARQP